MPDLPEAGAQGDQPGKYIAEGESADAFAKEAEAGEADGGGHAADLAVFAFAEFESEPGIDDFLANADGGIAVGVGRGLLESLGAAAQAFVTFDHDGSAAEFGEGGFIVALNWLRTP